CAAWDQSLGGYIF
nr:immunoglobulin light chain junction region [Macaca mulatta]